MIVRTYQRRNKGQQLTGARGSSGSGSWLCDHDEGGTANGSVEDDDEPSSSSWWSAPAHQHDPFSFPSSQGSSDLSPTQGEDPSLDFPDSLKPKLGQPSSPDRRSKRTEGSQNTGRTNSSGFSFRRKAGDGSSSAFGALQQAAASLKGSSAWGPCAPPTSTLMEAQESGEMMEHVDEANFALDGLRPGQPPRIRRASLLSLLSICGTMQRRRLLRTHGMVKLVLDAVLQVPMDDSSSALAASALLYVMAGDGQDEDFFDSSDCIQFLMKLLGPTCPPLHDKKLSGLGNKLLGLGSKSSSCKVESSSTGNDQGGALVVEKVNDLLSSMKTWGDVNVKGDDQSACPPSEAPSSQWLALLTLERACLSTVVLEDNAGSVRRIGGRFKERLRELGGLDALCELAAKCFLHLREIVKSDLKAINRLQRNGLSIRGSHGLGMLLRCLKVMENVTFLSENNQRHLLDMIVSKGHLDSSHTFVGVVVGTINIVSEFILEKRRWEQDSDCYKQSSKLDGSRDISCKVEFERENSMNYKDAPYRRPRKTRTLNSDAKGLVEDDQCNRKAPRPSGQMIAAAWQKMTAEDSRDPFDFDFSDGRAGQDTVEMNALKKQKGQEVIKGGLINAPNEIKSAEGEASVCGVSNGVPEVFDARVKEDAEEKRLLEDCLLSAVKVLMNLTNDNDLGCCRVAACGGLDAMASLIAEHYPSFQYVATTADQRNEYGASKRMFTQERNFNQHDQDLDLLVVVLGVLVNLVEKDTKNRGRLASLDIEGSHLKKDGRGEQNNFGMIKLLCSIFLSKEGAGKAVETNEGKFAKEIDNDDDDFEQGQQEAEDMILEAYSALLLAFLSKEGLAVRSAIGQHLPRGNLSTLVPVLERFLAFHLSLNMLSAETHASVRDVIDSCKDTS